jgi:hypothetical protein
MKDRIRASELQIAYDRIMARENLQVTGPAGSGKTYLLAQLKQKLEGRRLILSLGFEGLFQFEELVFRLREGLEETCRQNAGLEYQVKRLNQEHPQHRIREKTDLLAYLENLTGLLFNVGLDLVISLINPEFSEVPEIDGRQLVDSFSNMARAANIQLLVLSEESFLPKKQHLALEIPALEEVWDAPTEQQASLLQYCKGNLAFLKALEANIKRHSEFKPDDFYKTYAVQFRMLRARFTDLQWRLLRALASEEMVSQPHAFDFLVRHKLGAASSVERALRNLLDSKYIYRNEEGYQLSDPILHRWIQYLYFQKGL